MRTDCISEVTVQKISNSPIYPVKGDFKKRNILLLPRPTIDVLIL